MDTKRIESKRQANEASLAALCEDVVDMVQGALEHQSYQALARNLVARAIEIERYVTQNVFAERLIMDLEMEAEFGAAPEKISENDVRCDRMRD